MSAEKEFKLWVKGFLHPGAQFPKFRAKLEARLRRCLPEFPDYCEGSLHFRGVEYFFTYVVKDDVVDVVVMPRDKAEAVLNELGLSTHEEFNPLPGSEHKH